MKDLTQSFTWRDVSPIILEHFRNVANATRQSAIDAVQVVAERDYPSQARRQLKTRSAVEDRTIWSIWHLTKIDFLAKDTEGNISMTDAGRQWLTRNPYPINAEGRRELGVLAKATTGGTSKSGDKSGSEESAPSGVADYFWVVRSGSKGEREQASLSQNLLIPGMELGDKANVAQTREEIQAAIIAEQPDYSKSRAANFAGQLARFKNEIQVGDLVIMPSKQHRGRFYAGRVSGPYEYRQNAQPEHRHVVPIEWSAETIALSDIGFDLRKSLSALSTIFQVSRNDALERIESVLQGEGDPRLNETPEAAKGAQDATFDWAPFYEELSTALLEYQEDRPKLFEVLHSAADSSNHPSRFDFLWEWVLEDGKHPATDIDPFVIMATPNRQITWSNKQAVCLGFKEAFGLSSPVPTDFLAVPQVSNMNSRFERYPSDCGNKDFYDGIWNLLKAAKRYAQQRTEQNKEHFRTAFDAATAGRAPGKYTMALFWACPDTFLPLDNNTVRYLESPDVLGYKIDKTHLDGKGYLELIGEVAEFIADSEIEPKNYIGLSLAAFNYDDSAEEITEEPTAAAVEEKLPDFTIDKLIEKGCFVPREDIQLMMSRLREKKNLILQGPPGTGKTWIARELAKILCDSDAQERITAVQFHPSMSYEDFVQGFRPGSDGRLVKAKGPFLAAVDKANEDTTQPHVVVIEEINRGNPAQIFGEMLTLLEADKRGPGNELSLLYGEDDEPIFIPKNLFIIGTMNQADRSLAMVDMALRRRFAFVNLRPQLQQRWHDYCVDNLMLDGECLNVIKQRVEQVNALIADDFSLGEPYLIGHSYVTPTRALKTQSFQETRAWFDRVIASDLRPLLEEYWYDNPSKFAEAMDILHG